MEELKNIIRSFYFYLTSKLSNLKRDGNVYDLIKRCGKAMIKGQKVLHMCGKVQWRVPLFNKSVHDSIPTPINFQISILAYLKLLANCVMVWVTDRQAKAKLYTTLVVSMVNSR